MPTIRTVGICSKPNSAEALAVVPRLLEWLGERSIAVRCDLELSLIHI